MERRFRILLEFLIWFSAAALLVGVGLLTFEITAAEPDGLALVGSLGLIVTQTIALIGVLTRKSAESEAEHRLKADTSIRALELIETGEVSVGSRAQASAVVHALLDLGYLDSALSLVDGLWPHDAIDSGTAVTVIDTALRSETDLDRANGAALLAANASKTLFPSKTKPSLLLERKFLSGAGSSVLFHIFDFIEELISSVTFKSPLHGAGIDADVLTAQLNHVMPELLALSGVDQAFDGFDDSVTATIDTYLVDMAVVYLDAVVPIFISSDVGLAAQNDGALNAEDVRREVESLLPNVDPYYLSKRGPKLVKEWIEAQVGRIGQEPRD